MAVVAKQLPILQMRRRGDEAAAWLPPLDLRHTGIEEQEPAHVGPGYDTQDRASRRIASVIA